MKAASLSYQENMRTIMHEYQMRNPSLTNAIIEKMIEKGYDTPRFSLYSYEEGSLFLEEHKEDLESPYYYIPESNFILVFCFPEPLDRFWYKENKESEEARKEDSQTNNMPVEWGYLYSRSIRSIWKMMDETSLDVDNEGLILSRLNEIGNHKRYTYYYVWSVTER